jgi:hypothetical protein
VDVLAQHIKRLRENIFLRDALVVIVPESNLPTIAHNLMAMFRANYKMPQTFFMTEDNNPNSSAYCDQPGSNTTAKNKLAMVHILINSYLKPHKICLHRGFLSDTQDATAGVLDVRKELVKQMHNFSQKKVYKIQPGMLRVIYCISTQRLTLTDGSDRCEIHYGGKLINQNDDIVLCIMIGVYMHQTFFLNQKYQANW